MHAEQSSLSVCSSSGGVVPSLLLFDIDGTLLQKASQSHANALYGALHAVHGVDVKGLRLAVSAAGRTDGEIARLLLSAAGVPDEQISAQSRAVAEACCHAYASDAAAATLRAHVVPGIAGLLADLGAREDIRLGLVTGNYEQVARAKLTAAGLLGFFDPWIGGFGSDSERRSDLPPLARARAGSPGAPWPRERTLVIGDTPRDIACARADALRVIAVTTGPHPRSELLRADTVATDVPELAAAINALV